MTEIERVPANDKNFVGIGKIVFDKDAEWNIPHLHFMVDKTNAGNYEATLLEFGLISWAEKRDEAIKSLIIQTHSYIFNIMEKTGFDEFIKEVDSYLMDDYWRQYRKIEFTLAKDGRDLSHEIDRHIVQAIKEMLSEETKNILLEIAKHNAEKLKSEVDRLYKLNPHITYNEIKAAA
ncbi:MAG: hypothetical protein FWD26_07135 [Treponema sp.]|nr:hypothetical protein [Treponema sp.]